MHDDDRALAAPRPMPIDPAQPADNAHLESRVAAVVSSPAVRSRREPSTSPWPTSAAEPPELAALYAATDGIELADGTVILARGELAGTTSWLKQERALDDWPEDLIVLGERRDLVVVLDLDREGARAGGGVLEAGSDGLSTFKRVALNVVGYLESRIAPGGDRDPPPEISARDAAARRDAAAIAAAIARPFYPGAELELAHAALTLGSIFAERGSFTEAMEAFERSVEARRRGARRGAEAAEERAGWRACAVAAEKAGALSISIVCAERAKAARR